jgi:hypothetical protein
MQCECGSKKISHVIMDPDWNNPNADYSKTEVYKCVDCGKEINPASQQPHPLED